ncbi:SMP-30/gluconolactonase/LRE family protein [Kordiimonas sp. SCSIO 12603]|uniref:SMP-30/gluconolactonase/LRE family protein n=1 Tax=Kordiimonas sp. SCSIO 12603 TaxID=2829596 RepID=UPI0021062FCD|nr:SMP-30/gluconolactonase/LRE family protein [Kordiimonas sp. SCSIO 12603]UTW58945.1 SMP-30/gluconolactonase/LRE family protein [Kordiimonas sp. SCSIO 12603]
MTGDILHSVPVQNQLGEGIIWDHRTSTLLWTDILGKRLFQMKWEGIEIIEQALPEKLCSFGLTPNPDRLIAAFETGLAYFTISTQKIEWLHKIYGTEAKNTRLNDGRVDRHGNFWVGGIVEDDSAPTAKLYKLSPTGKLSIHRDTIAISNSLSFSPSGHEIYFADTPNQLIEIAALDGTSPLMWHPFAKTDPHAYPDGATVDKEGNLWSAEWGAGRITAYTPEGKLLTRYNVPATQPTCCTFAGPELNYLCVTSATTGLSHEALGKTSYEGSMFILKTSFTGLPESIFAIKNYIS